MRIATWNVNSLRVRLPQLLEWLAGSAPDVLALQETKLTDEAFPTDELQAAGYHSVCSGQKTYNGVAILARRAPTDLVRDMPGYDDPQRRVLAASIGAVRVIDLYVPNGQSVGSDKYHYKLGWLRALRKWLRAELAAHVQLVVLGDFNIAPEDRDVHDPAAWAGSVQVSAEEREALRDTLALGLSDLFRRFEQPPQSFSWWDYRAGAFRRNHGLRIDLVLASAALAERCTACLIDREPRRVERASDHTPVVASFDI
ncbi:MAG TPA: exodeoxyribonuclease III [Steroidobacteraceae bacterium]|nr:exodeoxyribonuclease III [Steroidobacteraceae bacterium]